MSETREFELIEVLQFTTGCMFKDVESIYKMADWMTGDSNFTHELPRVMYECKPFILEQCPELSDVDLGDVKERLAAATDGDDKFQIVRDWVDREASRLGLPATMMLNRLPDDAHVRMHPVESLLEMMRPKKEES